MIKFVKYYSLEIYTVISMIFIVIAGIIGDLSVIQKFILVYTLLFILHEWEEGRYPGGFIERFARVLKIETTDELNHITRVPVSILLLIITIIPFCLHNYIIPVLVTATLGTLEGIIHIIFIKVFKMEKPYSPGMITAELQLMTSVLFYIYVTKNDMVLPIDYLIAFLIFLILFVLMQRSLMGMFGIKYFDFLKLVRKNVLGK